MSTSVTHVAGTGHLASLPAGIPPCCLPGSTGHALPAPGRDTPGSLATTHPTNTEGAGVR